MLSGRPRRSAFELASVLAGMAGAQKVIDPIGRLIRSAKAALERKRNCRARGKTTGS